VRKLNSEKYGEHERIWNNIVCFRQCGEIEEYFVDGQEIDPLIADELAVGFLCWTSLLANGALGSLESESVRLAREDSTVLPIAATLKAYMTEFKIERGIELWDLENMSDLRLSIYQVSEKLSKRRRRLEPVDSKIYQGPKPALLS